jgi:hypothetical protein
VTCRRSRQRPTGLLTEIDTRSAVVEYVRQHDPLCLQAGDEIQVVRSTEDER